MKREHSRLITLAQLGVVIMAWFSPCLGCKMNSKPCPSVQFYRLAFEISDGCRVGESAYVSIIESKIEATKE